MNYSSTRSPLQQYVQIKAHTKVEHADPHKLIQLLFEGALDKISSAKGSMHRAETAQKCQAISDVIAILSGLRMSLDKDAGGELAMHLENLYSYMESRLLRANYENNPTLLDEVASLLYEVKAAWDAIPESVIQSTLATRQASAGHGA